MGIVSGTATNWTRLRTALTPRRSVWGFRDRVNAISTIGGAVDQQFATLRYLSLLWSTRQKYTSTSLDCVSVRDDSQALVKPCLPHVLRELFPMTPAVNGF